MIETPEATAFPAERLPWAARAGRLAKLVSAAFQYRRAVNYAAHVVLIVASSYTALSLRFDADVPENVFRVWLSMLPWLVVIRAMVFVPLRLFEGLWRYTSLVDGRNIVLGVVLSTMLFFGVVRSIFGVASYPQSVFLIDSLLLIGLMCGLRLSRRLIREMGKFDKGRRTLVFGAGDAGDMIVREIQAHHHFGTEVVGLIDDDPSKTKRRLRGVRVYGRSELPRVIADLIPQEVLIAIPSASPATLRGIIRDLQPYKVRITTIPNLRDLIGGQMTLGQVRTLRVEDLLSRAPIGLDPLAVSRLIHGRRILVTGAGGTIGSELCRQLAAFGPATLVLLERYENSLYEIHNDLQDNFPGLCARAVIADITDSARIDAVFSTYKPEIVFHAAAHKHVPLMESNPCEAIKNNVTGSRIVAEAANRRGIERFILISSDKAVNPSSVMGATKRVAETIVHRMASSSSTTFTIVRFGNVLASNGSVVPRFLEQIKRGGPVTVTHPDVRRYFMLIHEAVQLVLHAASLAGDSTYVLDMGEQIKLSDMARDLIRLSGFVPDKEIAIEYTGLRPGEKLEEELICSDETAGPSPIDKVLKVTKRSSTNIKYREISKLEVLGVQGDAAAVLRQLQVVVPTFKSPALCASAAQPLTADTVVG